VSAVRETVALVLGLDPAAVDERTSPQTEPRWDSMRHLDLVLALEDRLGVRFTIDELATLRSVGAIEAVVAGRAKPG
jgi:acyl carrier protein